MAWTINLDFVSVGDPVSAGYIGQFIGNILEDDVAIVTRAGQLVVGTGKAAVERNGEEVVDGRGYALNIGAENHVLRSAAHPSIAGAFVPVWVSPASLSSDFVTWGTFINRLGLR